MCLFVELTLCDPQANASRARRVLKGASALSAYPFQVGGRASFSLQNDPTCACDLLKSGGHGAGGVLELSDGGLTAPDGIASAMVEAGLVPFEVRVFWAEARVREIADVDLKGFHAVVRENAFDSGTCYRVHGM